MTSRRNFLEKVKTKEVEIFHLSVSYALAGRPGRRAGAAAAIVSVGRE